MSVPFFENAENRKLFFSILKSWLGTPYRRNCAVKGRGADCSLWIAASLHEAGILTSYEAPAYLPRDWHVHGDREIFLESFLAHVQRLAPGLEIKEIGQAEKLIFGDLIIMSVSKRKLCNHSALVVSEKRIMHSIEKLGVIEDEIRRWTPYQKRGYRLWQSV